MELDIKILGGGTRIGLIPQGKDGFERGKERSSPYIKTSLT